MRTQTFDVPPQEVTFTHLHQLGFLQLFTFLTISIQILTKDSVTVFVNAIMYYKVKDPTSAVANVDDYSGSSRLLAATTLRNILGTRNLGDILSERESIAIEMKVSEPLVLFEYLHSHFFRQLLMKPQIPGEYKWREWR